MEQPLEQTAQLANTLAAAYINAWQCVLDVDVYVDAMRNPSYGPTVCWMYEEFYSSCLGN